MAFDLQWLYYHYLVLILELFGNLLPDFVGDVPNMGTPLDGAYGVHETDLVELVVSRSDGNLPEVVHVFVGNWRLGVHGLQVDYSLNILILILEELSKIFKEELTSSIS